MGQKLDKSNWNFKVNHSLHSLCCFVTRVFPYTKRHLSQSVSSLTRETKVPKCFPHHLHNVMKVVVVIRLLEFDFFHHRKVKLMKIRAFRSSLEMSTRKWKAWHRVRTNFGTNSITESMKTGPHFLSWMIDLQYFLFTRLRRHSVRVFDVWLENDKESLHSNLSVTGKEVHLRVESAKRQTMNWAGPNFQPAR